MNTTTINLDSITDAIVKEIIKENKPKVSAAIMEQFEHDKKQFLALANNPLMEDSASMRVFYKHAFQGDGVRYIIRNLRDQAYIKTHKDLAEYNLRVGYALNFIDCTNDEFKIYGFSERAGKKLVDEICSAMHSTVYSKAKKSLEQFVYHEARCVAKEFIVANRKKD